jgi:RHS repeat-associated protein
MADGTGTTSYAYDSRDRLLSKSTPEGLLTYTYDAAGNRLSVKSDSAKYDVAYGYDGLNRLSTVKDNAGGAAASYSYDAVGRMSGVAYGNGASTQYGYDALNRVTGVTVGTNLGTNVASVLASYTYALYPTGNRKSVTEKSGRTASWQYDGLWRLTNEVIAGGSANGSISYTYDSVGNRLSRTSSVAGVPSTTSSYDNNDRLMSDSWDPNGNTVQSGANQYGYDSENRLLSLNRTAANYVYDGDGQLVQKTVGGVTTTYLIDDQTPAGYTQIAEERVSRAVTKSYVYGPQRISMRDSSGLHYYGYDAHSGVRLLMDGSGAVTDSWDYDAFGSVIARTGTTDNALTYRGEQVDSSLGLQYLRARWMDPGKGRFWTRDRFQEDSDSGPRLNKYEYVVQDPVDKSDPTGYCDCTIPSVEAGTIGAFSTTIGALSTHSFVRPILSAIAAASAGAVAGAISRDATKDRPESWNRMLFQVQGPGFNSSVPAFAPEAKGVTVLEGAVALEAAWLGIWADQPGMGDKRIFRVYDYAIVAAAEYAVLQQIDWMSSFPANGGWFGGNNNHTLDFPTPYGEGRVDVVNARGHNLRYLW